MADIEVTIISAIIAIIVSATIPFKKLKTALKHFLINAATAPRSIKVK